MIYCWISTCTLALFIFRKVKIFIVTRHAAAICNYLHLIMWIICKNKQWNRDLVHRYVHYVNRDRKLDCMIYYVYTVDFSTPLCILPVIRMRGKDSLACQTLYLTVKVG